MGDQFKDTLKKAGDVLKDAKKTFDDFADSVSESIAQSFSFSGAKQSVDDIKNTLVDAQTDFDDAQKSFSEAGDDLKMVAKAQETVDKTKKVLDEARKAFEDAGIAAGGGFIAALTGQANKIKDYGVLVDRLLAAGLKEPALQQVLAAGVDAGSAIATELLASATGVLEANKLAEDVAAIGDKVGLNAAGRFRQAGIDLATTFVGAITEIIDKAKFKLSSKGLSVGQLNKLKTQFGVDIEFAFSSFEALPKAANGMLLAGRAGGYNINAGEAGAEAVIPITRPRRALELMEESGLASLARGTGTMSPAVHIDNAVFATPSDADLVAQRVMVGWRSRA